MQDDAGFSSRVSLNAFSNILRTAVVAVTGLLMVPFYIGELGFGAYAVVFLATTVSAYFSSASEAVSQAFVRYLVLNMRGEDAGSSSRAFSTAVSGMLRCVLLMAVACSLVSAAAPFVFDVGMSAAVDVQILFMSVLAAGLAMAMADCLGGVFVASNRLYIPYAVKSAHVVLQAVSAVLLLLLIGPSLAFVGLAALLSSAVCLVFLMACIRSRVPEARFSMGLTDRGLMREMGGLGAWSLLCEIGMLLFMNASLMVVNLLLGNDAQATFSIAANVSSMIGTVSIALAAVAAPLLYRCHSEGDLGGAASTARLFMKVSGVAMAFPLAFLTVFSAQAIEAWIGPGHGDVSDLVRILMPAEVVFCAAGPLVHVPVTFMQLRPAALWICVLGSLNVAGAALVLGLTDLGMPGVCIVWAASVVALRMGAYPAISSRLTGSDVSGFLRPIVLALVLYAASSLLLLALSMAVEVPATIAGVVLPAAVLFAVYAAIAVRTMFDREEKEKMASFLPESSRAAFERIAGMEK